MSDSTPKLDITRPFTAFANASYAMRPSELVGNRSRTHVRSCSRAIFDMPSINLPCGPIGTVFESQKSSKLEYEIGILITHVSIEESPAVSHAFCMTFPL